MFLALIVFNKFSLKYVVVSLYEVARSLTIIFPVVFKFVLLGQLTSLPASVCCSLVLFGCALVNAKEMRLSSTGVGFGGRPSSFVLMSSISLKTSFYPVDKNPWNIALYSNVGSSLLFIPLIRMFGEVRVVMTSSVTPTLHYWPILFLSGLLGVKIFFDTVLQI